MPPANFTAERSLDNNTLAFGLIEKGVNLQNLYYRSNGFYPLHQAIANKNNELVEKLLDQKGIDPNAHFDTAYYTAILSFLWIHYYHDHFLFTDFESLDGAYGS